MRSHCWIILSEFLASLLWSQEHAYTWSPREVEFVLILTDEWAEKDLADLKECEVACLKLFHLTFPGIELPECWRPCLSTHHQTALSSSSPSVIAPPHSPVSIKFPSSPPPLGPNAIRNHFIFFYTQKATGGVIPRLFGRGNHVLKRLLVLKDFWKWAG